MLSSRLNSLPCRAALADRSGTYCHVATFYRRRGDPAQRFRGWLSSALLFLNRDAARGLVDRLTVCTVLIDNLAASSTVILTFLARTFGS